MKFHEFDLHPDILAGVDKAGFTDCTEVQERTLKYSLSGRDVAVQSQTGTGKTAAFLITIFQLMSSDEKYRNKKALIVAPTRELAVQIEHDAKILGEFLPFRYATFFGGVGYGPQEKALADGVEIMIGTPGRMLDLEKSRKMDMSSVGIAVIDEADRLFDMGFYPDIRRIMRKVGRDGRPMTMLFSATLSNRVRNLSWEYMDNPEEIAVSPEHMTVESIDQSLYHVSRAEKMQLLLGILKRDQPENALIFANTKRATEEVARRLQHNGFSCTFIMGDIPQKKRLRIIDQMKHGKTRFLVATDVAARGLHIDDLDMVINYDIPEDPENYVHRIGRTARAGKSGKAVSLACERYVFGLEAIEDFIEMKIPVAQFDDADLAHDESEHVHIRVGRTAVPRKDGNRNASRRSEAPRERRPRGNRVTAHNKPEPAPAAASRKEQTAKESQKQHHSSKAAATHRDRSKGGQVRRSTASRQGKKDAPAKPTASTSMKDRLEYYRQKYGEDFELTERVTNKKGGGREQTGKEGGLVSRLGKLFQRKK